MSEIQVLLIVVGKIKERYLQEAISDYRLRLRPYITLKIIEIPEEKRPHTPSAAEEVIAIEREGERIIAAVPEGWKIIILDLSGVPLSSPQFAKKLQEIEISGRGVAFIIGGDLGLSPRVISLADIRFSLSSLTFTHQLARLILIEQIYRAIRITRGDPYHK